MGKARTHNHGKEVFVEWEVLFFIIPDIDIDKGHITIVLINSTCMVLCV